MTMNYGQFCNKVRYCCTQISGRVPSEAVLLHFNTKKEFLLISCQTGTMYLIEGCPSQRSLLLAVNQSHEIRAVTVSQHLSELRFSGVSSGSKCKYI